MHVESNLENMNFQTPTNTTTTCTVQRIRASHSDLTDLHFVEGLATKLPRETFNIEHLSPWPRHTESCPHTGHFSCFWHGPWTDRGDPGPTCAYACVDTTSAGESAVVRWDVIGLVGSRQANSHQRSSSSCAPPPSRKYYSISVKFILPSRTPPTLCACARNKTFSGTVDVRLRSVSSRAPTITCLTFYNLYVELAFSVILCSHSVTV